MREKAMTYFNWAARSRRQIIIGTICLVPPITQSKKPGGQKEKDKMSADEETSISQEEESSGRVNLSIIDTYGSTTHFMVNPNTKFSRIFNVWFEKNGIPESHTSSYRFLWDGSRILSNATVQEYELDDGDAIDAVFQQMGGGV